MSVAIFSRQAGVRARHRLLISPALMLGWLAQGMA